MTINQLINDETISQKIKNASISPVTITMWINDLESQVHQLLFEPLFHTSFSKFYYPEDADKELSLNRNDSKLYVKYLLARLDFVSGDMDSYNVSAKDFAVDFEMFKILCR